MVSWPCWRQSGIETALSILAGIVDYGEGRVLYVHQMVDLSRFVGGCRPRRDYLSYAEHRIAVRLSALMSREPCEW